MVNECLFSSLRDLSLVLYFEADEAVVHTGLGNDATDKRDKTQIAATAK